MKFGWVMAMIVVLLGMNRAQGVGAQPSPGAGTQGIVDVEMDLNHIHKWDMSNGDTWDPFWADDGNMYAFNCDGRGFGRDGKNLAFNRFTGGSVETLTGSLKNPMNEYGNSGQKEADGATWKACGQECIDGIFYCFVSRNTYGSDSHDPLVRQTALNCSLIKSTDRGATWTRTAAENYKSPMWPGGRFGAPFFVHYGQNGGSVDQDDARKYVYATSTNGFWNDGDSYILGRVERARLPDLIAADWTYYTGGDGMAAGNWSPQIEAAKPLLSLPAHCGQGPETYIPSLGQYVVISWYNTPVLKRWFEPAEMKYDFYTAAHPWGPWNLVRSFTDKVITNGHWYGPSLCARFQEKVGPDVKVALFTSGCPFDDQPTSLYKMWEIPIILKTTPEPPSTMVNDDDPAVVYTGHWTPNPNRPFNDYRGDAHLTQTVGDSVTFTFTGTGVDFISERNQDHGNMDAYVDGVFQGNVDLGNPTFPRIAQVTVFSAHGLRPGRHTLRLVNKTTDYGIVDAFRIIDNG